MGTTAVTSTATRATSIQQCLLSPPPTPPQGMLSSSTVFRSTGFYTRPPLPIVRYMTCPKRFSVSKHEICPLLNCRHVRRDEEHTTPRHVYYIMHYLECHTHTHAYESVTRFSPTSFPLPSFRCICRSNEIALAPKRHDEFFIRLNSASPYLRAVVKLLKVSLVSIYT